MLILSSGNLDNNMARRPQRGDVVLGIRGWKIDYGTAGDYARSVAATQFDPIPDLPKQTWDVLNQTSALDSVMNRDALENPVPGKKIYTDSMYALMLFFQSDYVANLITRTQNKYKKYFLKNPKFPLGYDTVYLIQYLDFNTAEYPELTDWSFSIATPMVGKGRPYVRSNKLIGGND